MGVEIAHKTDAKEDEFEGVQCILDGSSAECSRIFLLLRAEDSEAESLRRETENERQKAKEEGEAAELRISNAEKLIPTLNHNLETLHISKRKFLQKMLDIIRELSKRLVVERKWRSGRPRSKS
jgi:hypothetical protein